MAPADLEQILADGLLASARAVPVAWAIPAFGGSALPAVVRLTIGLGFSAWCSRFVSARGIGGGAAIWLLLFVREILVGVALAFVVSCMFRAVESAGRIMDALRGDRENMSPIAFLMILLSAVAFFQIGGPSHIAWALERSYDAIPVAWQRAPDAQGAVTMAIVASTRLFESALGIAAPVLVAALLADVLVGAVARVLPDLPVATLGAPLRPVVVAAALLVGLGGMQLGLQDTLRAFLGILRGAWLR